MDYRGVFYLFQMLCAWTWAMEQYKDAHVPLIEGMSIMSTQARPVRISEFISSHKILDDIQREDVQIFGKVVEEKANKNLHTFGSTGLLSVDELPLLKSPDQYSMQHYKEKNKDELPSKIYHSSEKSTTMLPTLTTPRDTYAFDFVPVNIIHENSKRNPFTPLSNKNFEDLGDVNLVPAGTNTKIQVKKGPNGKDYEYEYVYYYYDEEEDSRAGGATLSNSQEVLARTSAPAFTTRRGNSSNRNKYVINNTNLTTTVEPVINEVIPTGNENRARQLDSINEQVSEERLPINTRFPPRSRTNHATESTERSSRVRGNRLRPTSDVIDTNSFREHQDGPEFPQSLPNGPIRFLGVTPNEGSDDKIISRSRGRPQRLQEPVPVKENYDETILIKKKTFTEQYDNSGQQEKDHIPQKSHLILGGNYNSHTTPINKGTHENRDLYLETSTENPEIGATKSLHAMDKVALDLYAFLQQGRSNLIDFVTGTYDVSDGRDYNEDDSTTEFSVTTTTISQDGEMEIITSLPIGNTSTYGNLNISTYAATSTTMLTTAVPVTSFEETSTTLSSFPRGKFRRPGFSGLATSRNRIKNGSSTTDSSVTQLNSGAFSTQRARSRFVTSSPSGISFKRSRPEFQKQNYSVLEEQLHKESTEKANTEPKSATSRGRYRGTSTHLVSQIRTTVVPVTDEKTMNTSTISGSLHHSTGVSSKLSGNRRRSNRPSAIPALAVEEAYSPRPGESLNATTPLVSVTNLTEQQKSVIKLPGPRPKPLHKAVIKANANRFNLRPRLGQQTTTTTQNALLVGGLSDEISIEEPASEGTEEETREAPVERIPVSRTATVNPLNKLRNRNKIKIHPKTTTARTPLPLAARRSPLLPRRKTTQTPVEIDTNVGNLESKSESQEEIEVTEVIEIIESSTTSSKHDETPGLSSLFAPRRRNSFKKPGLSISAISE